MSLTASEQATIHYYQWDYRYRGYYRFDSPVDIEVPYIPFHVNTIEQQPIIDDGRISLFGQIKSLFLPESTQPQEESVEPQPINPIYIEPEHVSESVGLSIVFPKEQDIQALVNTAFLNMLSFTEYPISFEIIGTKDKIVFQFICNERDVSRVRSHLNAYFPSIIIKDVKADSFGFNALENVAIADFGTNDEFVRPIATVDNFTIDPLTSIIATLETLQGDDIAVFQTIFKGITSPLAKDIPYAVSDGSSGSFFTDAPEMPNCAKDKVSNPLFSVVMRIACQGHDNYRSQYLIEQLARSITSVSKSEYNSLIPLSNEGYHYDFHCYNLHHRLSNRLGFVLNSSELNTFVHYPHKTVVSKKMGLQSGKTKALPTATINQQYSIGTNEHNGIQRDVTLNDEMRLRHMHIIGATGVGKSTLMANLMIEDMKCGNGCALLDPHGDIVDDVLLRVPEHRKNDVIIIDPSDTSFPIGFNLLQANTDIEKIVLSSDLVSAFKRHATAWGDTMTSVLSNAINTFLESSNTGTLIELKRFLLEDAFRTNFLTTVDDPSLHYYWLHEYPMVKKRISPLLTRIDTFLRPKIVRYMLAQTKGIDFRACIEGKKILLIKLSQGLIGDDNSYLLGSLFLSKVNQVAQGRQAISKSQRHPFYIYCDEFHNFITPSISRILSGARKYGIGLILAHQELGQIDDVKTLNSVISNPYIRVCFRLGDIDARRLESGFSYFEQDDLQSLGIGQAIARIGTASNDFNLSTFPIPNLQANADGIKQGVVYNTRRQYSLARTDVEALLNKQLPQPSTKAKKSDVKKETPTTSKPEVIENRDKGVAEIDVDFEVVKTDTLVVQPSSPFEKQKQDYLKVEKEKERERKHTSLQNYVKTIASQHGYKAVIEESLDDNSRVDVGLIKDKIKIAVEISVTNSIDYEVSNINKSLKAKYHHIILICDNETHLKNIESKALKDITKSHHKKLYFINSNNFPTLLNQLTPEEKTTVKRIKGYKVKTSYSSKPIQNQSSITKLIASSLKSKKKK